MNFSPNKPWDDLTAHLSELLDSSYKAQKDAEPRRPYLGASQIAHHCDRFLGYSYAGVEKDADKGFSGQIYRVFDMGHDGETRMAQYLRGAGFELLTEKENGYQYGFSVADGAIKGHMDGVIVSGPAMPGLKYAAGWENKAVNNKGFNEFANKGVRAKSPLYYGQMQMLMAYMELEQFLFTVMNRDTAEVHAEVVPFDARTAQDLSDRAVRVVQTVQASATEALARCTSDSADYRCKFCEYAVRCWSNKNQQQNKGLPKPGWL